jgi:nucleoside-diphosphate-sugar epimerase|tara:strand:- start:2344 stop:3237 length:894 start_codon:yes stop_codon:yes gene_type:complete
MKDKIVITGATGFVGSNLVKHMLKKGFKISIIIRKNSDLSNLEGVINKIKIFNYDNDIARLGVFLKSFKPKLVFHLASNFIAEHKTEQVDSLIESNVTFGLHLLEAMKIAGVRNLINTGTSWQHYNNEEYNPVCLYAATKKAFESLIEYYIKAENFKVITLKLFDTYGETDTRPKLINLLNKFANDNSELKMSLGDQKLNLVHIIDVCKAYHIAYGLNMNKDSNVHQIYSIKGNESFKLKEVISIFEMVTNKKINILWGSRNYRKREVMNLWDKGIKLPKWKTSITLEEGLSRYKND